MAGITVLRNRTNVYVSSTVSFRIEKKNPQNKRKVIGLVEIGTNNVIFNSYGMAILGSQGIQLDSLNKKSLSEIGKIVDFSAKIDSKLYRPREINYLNSIEVKDDLISKFGHIKDIKNTNKRKSKDRIISKTVHNGINNINIADQSQLGYNSDDKDDYIEIDNISNNPKMFEDVRFNISELENHSDNVKKHFLENLKVKTYGTHYLLEKIADKIGLTTIIKFVFPLIWKQILALSFYICVNNDSLSYCQDWIDSVDSFIESNKLSSQRISDLLRGITVDDRNSFYYEWAKYRREIEYLALDVTSISSYSTQIEDLAWGYNRDKEKLRQINLCLLFGEDSKLPIYSSPYPGNITDVKAFCDIINTFNFLKPQDLYKIVLDKGFYSKKNINKLLYNEKIKFTISVPIKNNFVRDYIRMYESVFNDNNTFYTGNDIYYGNTVIYNWDFKHKLYLHIYFSELKHNIAKKDVQANMIMLKDEATKNPKLYRNTADHKNYLIYTPMNDNADKFDISLKLDKVKELYKNKGWFFILSNEISDYKEALRIYRQKDVVEKAFLRLKNNLDLNRLRTHNDITTENKLFIGFISLIFSSYIHKIMEKEGLYLLYTQKSLFKKLDALKFIYSNQQLTLKPISKTHEDIFKAFEFFIDKVNK